MQRREWAILLQCNARQFWINNTHCMKHSTPILLHIKGLVYSQLLSTVRKDSESDQRRIKVFPRDCHASVEPKDFFSWFYKETFFYWQVSKIVNSLLQDEKHPIVNVLSIPTYLKRFKIIAFPNATWKTH